MDEILSKLRKPTQKSPKKTEIYTGDVSKESNMNTKDISKYPAMHIEENALSSSDASYLDELTSSQYVTPFTIMKLDFDRLRSIKTDLSIIYVLNAKEYKINEELVIIIKKIEKFTSEICHMEMVDESGSIGCSCMYSVVKDTGIRIGSIIKIQGFSLWKMEVNHINLVRRNITEIY
jgi:hypothetical protein